MGTIPKQTFLQRRYTDAPKFMKSCLTTLIIRKMQIKTTVRYHLTTFRIAIIEKFYRREMWRKCWRVWRKGNILSLLLGVTIGIVTMKNNNKASLKNKNKGII